MNCSCCGKCVLPDNLIESKIDESAMMRRYVPYYVAKEIAEMGCCIFENKIEYLEGSIAFLDIVGFTTIVSEYVSNKRDVGELCDIFSSYYSVMLETLREFGGSVFQFAGDSIVIGFEISEGETPEQNWQRSFAAMYRVWELSVNYNDVLKSANGFALQPKIGMSYGNFYQFFLGNTTRFITPIYSGEAIRSAVLAEKHCDGQEFVISSEAYKYAVANGMKTWFSVASQFGFHKMLFVPENFVDSVERPDYYDLEGKYSTPLYYRRLKQFINPIIIQQVRSNFQGFYGDYREATCVMIRFSGAFTKALSTTTLEEAYENFNAVYELMQDTAGKYGAFCNQPDISDKGLVFPVLFGATATSRLEEKEKAAVFFADEIMQKGKVKKFINSMNAGIASGTVYAGEFGGLMRKDFTVVGNIINLAARLMMFAADKAPFTFLIDENTYKKVSVYCNVEAQPPMLLKGFTKKQVVYLFNERKKEIKRDISKANKFLFGRENEFKKLYSFYKKAMQNEITVLPLLGETGIGKTLLLDSFISYISKENKNVKIISVACFEYEQSTFLYYWREIINNLFDFIDFSDKESSTKQIETILNGHFPNANQLKPLFIRFFFNEFTEKDIEILSWNDEFKIEFFTLICKLLKWYANGQMLVITIEHMNWSDDFSFELLDFFLHLEDSLQFALYIIPMARKTSNLFEIIRFYNLDSIELTPLDIDYATKLTASLLNLDKPNTHLFRNIVYVADAYPVFILDIIKEMKENGSVVPGENGKNIFTRDNIFVSVPDSVNSIILSHLNSLLFEEQVVIKTAAVLGRFFSINMLRELIPEDISDETMNIALDLIFEKGLLKKSSNDSLCVFKYSVARDIIISTVLENTRKEINMRFLSYLNEHENSFGEKTYLSRILMADCYQMSGDIVHACELYAAAFDLKGSYSDEIKKFVDLAEEEWGKEKYETSLYNFMIAIDLLCSEL